MAGLLVAPAGDRVVQLDRAIRAELAPDRLQSQALGHGLDARGIVEQLARSPADHLPVRLDGAAAEGADADVADRAEIGGNVRGAGDVVAPAADRVVELDGASMASPHARLFQVKAGVKDGAHQ